MNKKLIAPAAVICSLLFALSGCATAEIKEEKSEPVEVVSEAVSKEIHEAEEIRDEVPEEKEEIEDNAQSGVLAAKQKKPKGQTIVWLGDSLTQGSLGDKDDNLPGAPYETLKKMVNVPVEGYGFYGHNTHDILWLYRDEDHFNQRVDPNKTYIFWVGSCDWCPEEGPNANTAPVMAEIDNFLAQNGGVKNYIVMGTTSRWRLGDLYIPINKDLAAHYGVHYLDVIDIINQYGYSPDNTHLSQASYDNIAKAVYAKLKALGYI